MFPPLRQVGRCNRLNLLTTSFAFPHTRYGPLKAGKKYKKLVLVVRAIFVLLRFL